MYIFRELFTEYGRFTRTRAYGLMFVSARFYYQIMFLTPIQLEYFIIKNLKYIIFTQLIFQAWFETKFSLG